MQVVIPNEVRNPYLADSRAVRRDSSPSVGMTKQSNFIAAQRALRRKGTRRRDTLPK